MTDQPPLNLGDFITIGSFFLAIGTLWIAQRRQKNDDEEKNKKQMQEIVKPILTAVEKNEKKIDDYRKESGEGRRELYAKLDHDFVRKDVHEAEINGVKMALHESAQANESLAHSNELVAKALDGLAHAQYGGTPRGKG